MLTSNAGREVRIKLKSNLIDPLPRVIIGDTPFHLEPPLRWHECLWICFPLILALAGGAVGGAIGGLAVVGNGRVFRSNRGTAEKYSLAALISLCALTGYVVLSWAAWEVVSGGAGAPPLSSLLLVA